MKKLIKQFNQKDTLVVITSYPTQNSEPAKQNAVACYAQNLLRAYKHRKVIILSETNDGYNDRKNTVKNGQVEYEKQGNRLIVRCWRPGSPSQFRQILNSLKQFDKTNHVLIQFEFNMLGSVILTALMPALILAIKLMGKKVTLMQHQVVGNLSSLSGHVNIKIGSAKSFLFNGVLHLFYKALGIISDKIIVHEKILKNRLKMWVNEYKISVISHGLLPEEPAVDRDKIRDELGYKQEDFVLLMFGYITWYKGVDWIARKVARLAKTKPELNLKLIIAGGESATLNSKKHYREFVKKVEDIAKKSGSAITITGFVPEDKVKNYYLAADLVVLPYRTMMSASGPLSFALRFKKPFVISEALLDAMQNEDVQYTFSKFKLKPENISFKLNGASFTNMIKMVVKNPSKLAEMTKVSAELANLRSWENIVFEYDRVLDEGVSPTTTRLVKAQGRYAPNFYKFRKLPAVSAFFPAYNEEGNIENTVKQALHVLPDIADEYEVIVVDDGSTDRTFDIAQELSLRYPRVRAVTQTNKGYGGAVKRGFSEVKYDWVFFSDADQQFDIEELTKFIPRAHDHDLVIGFRRKRAEGFKRAAIAKALKIWNKAILNFPTSIKDIDCAFKLMKKDVLDQVTPLISDGAMVTTEFLLKAYQCGYSFSQVGVNHYPRQIGSSTGNNPKVIARAVTDTFVLYKKLIFDARLNGMAKAFKLDIKDPLLGLRSALKWYQIEVQ